MNTLICGITTQDGFGNKHRLKVRMAPDGSMHYHLKSLLGSTSFALSNLQLRQPLPEMRGDTLKGTIQAVISALDTGVERPIHTDTYAKKGVNEVCMHCGADL